MTDVPISTDSTSPLSHVVVCCTQERKTQLAKAAWVGEQVGVDAAAAAAAGSSGRLLQQAGAMGVRADDIRQLMGLA
jgi:hypothetical protein